MRKSPLAISISMALAGNAVMATSRYGPVPPYRTWINREIYYRMIGQEVHRARSIGKTLAYPSATKDKYEKLPE